MGEEMKKDGFAYSYAAPTEQERKEIAAIRKQYQTLTASQEKLQRLRALDKRVKDSANIVAIVLGVVGCLIFGGGMALVLEWGNLLFGIPMSALGFIPMSLAYPMYHIVLCKNKQKYGEEILRLSEELLGEKEQS